MAHTRTFDGSLAGGASTSRPGFASGYIDAFQKWRSRRRAIAELQRLGDRELADIGVSRSEIESVVYWAGNDPTRLRRG